MKTRSFIKVRCPAAMVLVVVLWIIVLMTIIIAVVSQISRLDARISMASAERMRCKWACRAGLESAVAVLNADERDSDSLKDLWAYSPADFNDVQLDRCRFSVEITDEAGKLNINTATKEQLLELPDMTEDIADSILDWRDNDDQARAFGAEAGYYLNLPYGYPPRDADFKTIRELLRIRGVSRALLYGDSAGEDISAYNAGWIRYLTCYSYDNNTDAEGNDRVNINRAGENELTEKLGISPSQAKWIVQNRRYESIADIISAGSQGQTNSQNRQPGQSQTESAQPSSPDSSGQSQEGQEGEPVDLNTFFQIADRITVTDDKVIPGRVNVNTAPLFVLTAVLEGNEQVAADIIAYRQGLDDGIASIAHLQAIGSMTPEVLKKFIGSVTTRSNVFTVRTVATAEATGAVYNVQAVVDRTKRPTEILYYCTGAGR